MMYFLFGKVGSGKSFLGEFLKTHFGAIHFDGDELLTTEMRAFICQMRPFTQQMRDKYFTHLKNSIKKLYPLQEQKLIIISQGIYKNTHRLDILAEFPAIKFVWVQAENSVCFERVTKRNNLVKSDYAEKIVAHFELPQGFEYLIFDNNENNNPHLINQIHTVLKITAA